MDRAARQALCLPPPNFKPVRKVDAAWFVKPPGFIYGRGARGARAGGIRYERKAQELLQHRYDGRYLPSPWIRFSTEGGFRLCQPDGLLFDVKRGRLTVLEIKLKHTSDTYYQLLQFYVPVLAFLFPRALWEIRCCEIVKWYDPGVAFPFPTQLRENPEDSELDHIGVHILGVS
jgi:hypothetical protein